MRVLFIIASWLFFTACSAQNPYAIHINQFSGLPSNEIYDIVEDDKGFVWLATDLGITRFDGVGFVTYNPPSPYSKAGGSIKQDHLGHIWYCTYDGNIFMLMDGYMKKMNAKPVIGYDYTFDKEHLIYQAFDTIFVQSLYSLKILKKIPNSSETLTGIISWKSLFATINNIRLRSFEANGKELSQYSLGPLQANLLVFDGRYFFAGNKNNNTKNVQIFDGAELVGNITFDINCYLNRLNVVDNQLWLATTKGAFLCDDKKTQIVDTFFSGQSISKILKDRKGNYWFSTTNNGLFIVPKLNNFTYKLEGFKPKQIRKIDGGLIANSEFGDFYQVEPQAVTLLQKNVKDKRVFDVISFSTPCLGIDENTIGGFTYKGKHLYYSMQGCKEFANIDDKYLVMALSHSIFMVKKKNVVSSSPWDLIYEKYKDQNTKSLHECKLVKWGARAKSVVFSAMDNSIYCATNQGILVYDQHGMHEEKCDNKFINAIKILAYKNVVFALDYNGEILTKKSGKHFNMSKTLTNNGKTRQLKLCDSLLFMVKENVIEYVELDKHNLQTLDFKVNKLSLPINAALVNSVEFDNGYLYLAYNGELLKLKLEELRPINIEKDFILTGIAFNNVLTQPDRFIKVADDMNDVEIQFSILDFLNPNSHHIEYKINEDSWKSIAPHTRKLNLASLAPGEYHIKFRIDHNIFKQKVQFSIAYPWYQQWWFFALLLVSIGLLVYRIIRWRLDVVKHENQLLLEKKELENNLNNSILMSIKSQMNPHFLFNALNTIQSYIITEDKKNASSYLSKFSKLTRKILEMSEKDKVSLAEELESLQLYIDLEKIRFDTPLSTSINVDPSINTEAVFIPSMIIQPYIENAIKHGLLHKKGEKILTINIEKLNAQTILFVIDDNGIGRKKSNELNQIKHKGHHSFASEANQKRLEILNMGNKNISIEYIDKVDSDQAPTGTMVRLTVPHTS